MESTDTQEFRSRILDSPAVDWLFIDFNSYFASVEEQEIPALRGQPIAIIPVQADTTVCIAASYAAKAFGIQTGTSVREAMALCPGLRLIESRQDLYVDYHHRIVQAVEGCVPVDRVLSIDEMICRLTGSQRAVPEATALAGKIKCRIEESVGMYMRCSIGLAPNRFLAKVASDMQKPDGLTTLLKQDLPRILYRLSLRDLPGIGEKMEGRLARSGITTVEQLTQLSEMDMHRLWKSIDGNRFFAWLRGADTPKPLHRRYSIGHSHVLEPENRSHEKSYEVAKQLLAKAAERLRSEDLWGSGMTVAIGYPNELMWEGKSRFVDVRHTAALLKILEDVWNDTPTDLKPVSIAITLHPLIPRNRFTPSFF